MTTATDRTARHYILIERNGQGRQNWKSTPFASLQEAFEARDHYSRTSKVGYKYEVRAILNDGTFVIL